MVRDGQDLTSMCVLAQVAVCIFLWNCGSKPTWYPTKKKEKRKKKEEEGRAFFLYSNTSRDEYRGPPNTFGSPCLYIYIYNISTHFSSFFFSFSPHLAHQHFSLFFLCFSIPNKENICIGKKKTWGKERK